MIPIVTVIRGLPNGHYLVEGTDLSYGDVVMAEFDDESRTKAQVVRETFGGYVVKPV